MACLQIARSGCSPVLGIRSGFLPNRRSAGGGIIRPFRCHLQDDDDSSTGSNGKDKPESLFMKELKRRGMTPTTSLLENSTSSGKIGGMHGNQTEVDLKEEESGGGGSGRGQKKRNGVVSADYERGLENQRERSMALNSEGLEGLIPRAKLLLTIGGTFFLGFWPLMLTTIAFFSALYLYFGPSFIHDASKVTISPPPYVDPYALLEDERISQTAPSLK